MGLEMNKNIKSLLIVIILTFFLGACRRSYEPVVTHTCDLDLEFYVHQGENAGQIISGVVEFGTHSWNGFSGELVEEDGNAYPIAFSFDGSSVHFTVEHGDGRIFASGMMDNVLSMF